VSIKDKKKKIENWAKRKRKNLETKTAFILIKSSLKN